MLVPLSDSSALGSKSSSSFLGGTSTESSTRLPVVSCSSILLVEMKKYLFQALDDDCPNSYSRWKEAVQGEEGTGHHKLTPISGADEL